MMKQICSFLLVCCSVAAYGNPSANLNQVLQQIWQFELAANPINATSYGQHQYDALMPDLSAKALEKGNQQRLAFVAELQALPDSALSQQQQINKAFQLRELQNAIDEYRFHAHYIPLTSESGFHSSLAFLPQSTRFKTVADYQNYLRRLSQFPDWFKQQINWMREGMKVGLTQPKAVLKNYEKGVKAFITSTPEQSVYYRPFQQIDTKGFDNNAVKNLKEQAKQVVRNRVFIAYQKYYDFLRQDYIPAARDSIAAKDWPNGEAFYQNRTAFYTTTSMTPVQIHQLGLSEVKRIRGEMQVIIDKLQFDGGLADFTHYLRTDPRFYAKTADELMAKAAVIAKKLDAKLPSLFGKLPRRPYGVVPVPDSIAPKYTTGRYIPAAKDDEPGYYWVNTYALDKRPLYALTALTMHEAVPGHHLQISLSQEMSGLPEVRRNGYISAFGEGWGLYAEYLGKEAGMYQNPYDDFGRLSYEMWRACRLVVDTGMHLMGWSRQQAVDYMLSNTALSEHNINTEVDRYISWPAQALSYKIGELTIKRLRKQAEQQLGDKFDLRAFHDAVLANGSVPLNVLEQQIQRFIEQAKSN